MAKKSIAGIVKFQVPAQKATPAPPVGSTLGPYGASSPQFVQQFNEASKHIDEGMLVPVIVTIYSDRTFTFILKSPPAAVLIKKELSLKKGSKQSHKDKVGTITKEQLINVAKIKNNDLNALDIEAAIKIIAGTARSMGVNVEESLQEQWLKN